MIEWFWRRTHLIVSSYGDIFSLPIEQGRPDDCRLVAPAEALFCIGAGAGGYGLPTVFATADHFAQYFFPGIGGSEPAVYSMLDYVSEGVGGRRDGHGADSRGLKPFQFRLAISEQVVLERHEVHLYSADFALQIYKILKRDVLYPRAMPFELR